MHVKGERTLEVRKGKVFIKKGSPKMMCVYDARWQQKGVLAGYNFESRQKCHMKGNKTEHE